MTDTKELIDKLNDYLREIVVNNEQYEMFVEIKSFLEQQYQHEQNILDYGTDEPDEKQPQPDEELVKESSDKIIDICLTHTCVGSIKGEKFTSLPQGAVMDIQQVIRTLLQSRPVVTREEIEECFNHQCYIVENIIRLLKSKGIEVKGEG